MSDFPGPTPTPTPAAPPARPRRGGLDLLSVVIVLAVALVGAGAFVLYRQERDISRHQKATDRAVQRIAQEVTNQLKAQAAAVNGLSDRVTKLETALQAQPDIAAITSRVEGSVFTVKTADQLGTGFIVQSSGGQSLLMTDFHVIGGAVAHEQGHVKVAKGAQELDGQVVKTDENLDIALVSVNATFTPLARATAEPRVGDPMILVGSPQGLGGTATTGIISALREDFIQFSAATSPGSSGSPVIDRSGNVLGILTVKFAGQAVEGLSFAVPIAKACASVSGC